MAVSLGGWVGPIPVVESGGDRPETSSRIERFEAIERRAPSPGVASVAGWWLAERAGAGIGVPLRRWSSRLRGRLGGSGGDPASATVPIVGLTIAEFIPRQVMHLQQILKNFPLINGTGPKIFPPSR
jgi:hypothetical protein